MPKVILHTLENAYDDGNDYHQFIQIGNTPLLESKGVGGDWTLGEQLSGLIDDLSLSDSRHRTTRLLERLIQRGEINKFLLYAGRINLKDCQVDEHYGHRTRFGEYTYDAQVIVPPSLREQQDDMWCEDGDHPRSEWREEVAIDATTLGYWEYVAAQRELYEDVSGAPSAQDGVCRHCGRVYEGPVTDGVPYPSDDCPSHDVTIVPGMRVRWHDPDDGACTREGIVAKCTVPTENGITFICMNDGWSCQCLRHELEILP